MRILGKSGPYLIILFTIIPLLAWPTAFSNFGQIAAVNGTILFCFNFILAIRFRFLEYFFWGINRVYVYHHLFGAVALFLILLHPILILINYLKISIDAVLLLITPSLTNWPIVLGGLALISLITLMVLTLYIKLPYHTWKKTHEFMGIPLLLASGHGLFVSGMLDNNPAMKTYVTIFFLLGILSYFYKSIFKSFGHNIFLYKVTSIKKIGQLVEIAMQPIKNGLNFLEGQFVFARFLTLGIPLEAHPFTIASSSSESALTLFIKTNGDYTATLKLIEPESQVLLEGPFGRFGSLNDANKNQIWVAGGIGITPFLSMAKSKKYSDTTLYYCVKNKDEIIPVSNNVKTIIWQSDIQGRLTAEKILEDNPMAKDCDFYLCGPLAMMTDLKNQLRNFGIKNDQIYSEEFELY